MASVTLSPGTNALSGALGASKLPACYARGSTQLTSVRMQKATAQMPTRTIKSFKSSSFFLSESDAHAGWNTRDPLKPALLRVTPVVNNTQQARGEALHVQEKSRDS
uniref:Uncharacterized protein n=1 Tax=Ixodes ricinus TaxID=34613 RepID=A0A0K8RJ49_IXORI